jgi:hypothetical protein
VKGYLLVLTTGLTCGAFTGRFIEHGTSNGSPMATIDWEAAIIALTGGGTWSGTEISPALWP